MSKKLLEEQAVRKFMKIAGLQPLTNSFLKENEEADLEEAKHKDEKDEKDKKDKKKEMEEGYGKKKKMEESEDSDGETLEEEVEDLEENKEELEEGGGQMPFDEASRRVDERAPEDRVNEAKALVGKVKTKGGAKMSPAKKSTKNGSSGKSLVKEEEDMADVEGEDTEGPAMPSDGSVDVEGLVKELIRVITEKVPGAADVVSVEDEGDETEVEMGGEDEMEAGEESDMEGGEQELDETALENVVAETVKRVKARLMESQKPKTLSKEALAKKVAAKVAERLKKG